MSSSVFTTSAGQKTYSYIDDYETVVSITVKAFLLIGFQIFSHKLPSSTSSLHYTSFQLTPDVNYDQNDSIAAFNNVSLATLISNGPGYLQIPLPDFAGVCNDLNYATFENRIEDQTCARTLSTDSDVFAAQCEAQFSLSRYVTDLFIAR